MDVNDVSKSNSQKFPKCFVVKGHQTLIPMFFNTHFWCLGHPDHVTIEGMHDGMIAHDGVPEVLYEAMLNAHEQERASRLRTNFFSRIGNFGKIFI